MAAEDIKKDLKVQKNQIITPGDMIGGTTAINLATPEPWLMRKKAVEAAKRGEYPKSECMHPASQMLWMHDHVNERDREGRPVNLFECGICHSQLFLVDPYGKAASDG